MKTFKNFIGGEWVAPLGGEYFENTNPADVSDRIGRFPLSGADDVERAVESAKRGFEIWRNERGRWEEHEAIDGTWLWADGLRECVAALREGRAPVHEPQQDLHLLDVVDAARVAVREGRAVEVASRFPALDLTLESVPRQTASTQRLPDVRRTLAEYADAVHVPWGTLQVSPWHGYGQLGLVLDAKRLALTGPVDGEATPETFERARRGLRPGPISLTDTHPGLTPITGLKKGS